MNRPALSGACPAPWSSAVLPTRWCRWMGWPLPSPPQSHEELPLMPNAAEILSPDFEAFRKRAYQLTGLDLTSYKAPQMHRRLTALLQRQKIASFADYARVLETDAARRQ